MSDALWDRDRERTTVLVSKLPESAVDDDLRKLFKDVGALCPVNSSDYFFSISVR